jgi:hypothetical protein
MPRERCIVRADEVAADRERSPSRDLWTWLVLAALVLLNSSTYQEVKTVMITTYERGREAGMLEEARRATLRQLEAKFGPLAAEVSRRVEALSLEKLGQLQLDLLKAQSLGELELQD